MKKYLLSILLVLSLAESVQAETYQCYTVSETGRFSTFNLSRKTKGERSYFVINLLNTSPQMEQIIVDETEDYLWLAGTNHKNGGVNYYTLNKNNLEILFSGMIDISPDVSLSRGNCEKK